MFTRSRVLAATALLAVLVTASACSSDDDSSGGGSTVAGASGDLKKVTYVTAFGAVGRDSFIWVAKEKGYFKDAGIDIDIQKGAGNVQNLTLIKSGGAQFAALDFTGAEIQAGLGKFTNWRAIAAIHQQTLVSIMTTADTNITKPTDLAGKKVATAKGSVSELLFPAYAKQAGLDAKTVTIEGAQTTALNGLMAQRKVDALSTFLLSKKALETVSKKQVTVLPYSEYLSDLFGNAIIAREETIASDKDLVKKFTAAAMKGLQYTLDNPDEAAAILNKAEPTAAVPAAVGEINAMKPYVSPPNGAPLGHLDQERVARSIAVLQGNGLMPAGLTPEKIVDFSFIPAS
ncbi:ABC transporter substrate-binding protein [Paractinoplanes durhamensis]|uniref:Sulfonate ABC transporter substrate-binding protein n=1 Tax=Paractinoplanes durhamensis TaxID=113563 RepID=A0ABQ3YY50_9ACTN|nr:ABC transporter substrate-binding protein [Actinoplanes durhamensis]GIE02455.1 sulfonate ABC transporter substrate-binding protein [Actinoplanes durhamensis]